MDDLRVPYHLIEIREWRDIEIGGWRFIATVRFAVGTRVESERLEDCTDIVAQASLMERVKLQLAAELSEHPLAHHVPPGGVVELIDCVSLLEVK